MDNALAISLIAVGCGVCSVLAFLLGRWFDPYWQAAQLRRITNKDYGIITITSKDSKNLKSVVVDFNDDLINVGDFVWVIQKFNVYREDRVDKGFKINLGDNPREAATPVKWRGGIPEVFVDKDSIMPKEFADNEKDTIAVKPNELWSFVNAYIFNQIAKRIVAVKNIQLYLIIIMVGLAFSIGIGFMAYDASQQNTKALQTQNDKIDAISTVVTGITPTPEGKPNG